VGTDFDPWPDGCDGVDDFRARVRQWTSSDTVQFEPLRKNRSSFQEKMRWEQIKKGQK
jgi:hypothetical protein